MTFRFFVGSQGTPLALCLLAGVVACGPKSTPPSPVVAPPTASAPTVMQTCPDPSDGPSIVINAVDEAHRAFVANSNTPLPPVCVLAAFARIASPLPDSLDAGALALAGELRRRGSDQRELLATEIVLLARMRRYADVSAAYTRLVALDSQPAIEVSRLAITAAHQRSDTAMLIRILARTATRPGAGPSMTAELNVLRQVSALSQPSMKRVGWSGRIQNTSRRTRASSATSARSACRTVSSPTSIARWPKAFHERRCRRPSRTSWLGDAAARYTIWKHVWVGRRDRGGDARRFGVDLVVDEVSRCRVARCNRPRRRSRRFRRS